MKDMSEEKEFCKHDTHESHYCGDCHRELLASKDAEIKSLESRLKEALEHNEKILGSYKTDENYFLEKIQSLEQRLSQAEAQLPEGMKHCTIKFLECEKGHGRLIANNWIDQGCHWCRLSHLMDVAALKEKEAYEKGLKDGQSGIKTAVE